MRPWKSLDKTRQQEPHTIASDRSAKGEGLMKDEQREPYARPELDKLGNLKDLTFVDAGNNCSLIPGTPGCDPV